MKVCKRCQILKSLNQYSIAKTTKDKLQVYCKPCMYERVKEWRATNVEKDLSARKDYYKKNKDRLLKQGKLYRQNNIEKYKQYYKIYREQNKEKIKARQQACYAKNIEKYREYSRQYFINHPEMKQKSKRLQKLWREQNPDYMRNYCKAWRDKKKIDNNA